MGYKIFGSPRGMPRGADGGLIGGASLEAPDFVEIVNAANQEQ